ncbi:hypothetical protein CBL_13563 [Carabus blaptoides fortunei]
MVNNTTIMAREITKLIQELMGADEVPANIYNPELAKLRSIIAKDRVEDILNRGIEKAATAFCIDELVENNGEKIAPFLSDTELHDLLAVYNQSPQDYPGILPVYFQQYITDPEKAVPLDTDLLTHEFDLATMLESREYKQILQRQNESFVMIRFKALGSFNRPDTKMPITVTSDEQQEFAVHRSMLSILYHKQEILNLVRNILDKKSDMGPLPILQTARNLAIHRCNTSPYEIAIRNKILKRAWLRNQKARTYLEVGVQVRRAQLHKRKELLRSRVKLVKQYGQRLKNMEVTHGKKLEKIMGVAFSDMESLDLDSVEYTEKLQSLCEQLPEIYEKFLARHLIREKNRTARSHKHESVVANFIDVYDTEIEYVHGKLKEIKTRYWNENEELRDVQNKCESMLPQYTYEVEEAQYIERIMFEAKCREFIARRSVKKIQRWWRGILQRKKAKKKAKKGKKK